MSNEHRLATVALGAAACLSAFLAGPAGCGGGGSGSGGAPPPQTPGEQLCAAIGSYTKQCGSAGPCEEALEADCSKLVGLLSDAFLVAATRCVQAGGSPAGCLASSFEGLSPSAADQSFASTFCDQCTGGLIPGCTDVFFGGGSSVPQDLEVAGKLILPLGDSLVAAITSQCATASALTCVASFTTCAEGVLASQALPENTVECLVNGFVDGAPPAGDAGCTAGGTTSSSSSGPGGATSSASGGGTGGNSGTGPGVSSSSSGGGSCDSGTDCTACTTQDACLTCAGKMHPSGAQLFADLADCVVCDACYVTCDGASNGCSGSGTSACDGTVADASACGSTCQPCAEAGPCMQQTDACAASQDCQDYNTAVGACSNLP